PITTAASPFVGSDKSGNFVVVWSALGDGSGLGVFARRYDSAGVLQGGTFQVNMLSAGDQASPRVSFDEHGGFAIAWHGPAASGASGSEVFVRFYDAAGHPLAPEVQANTYDAGAQRLP